MKVKVHLPKEYILAHLLKHSFFFFGVGQRGTKLLKVTFAFFFFFSRVITRSSRLEILDKVLSNTFVERVYTTSGYRYLSAL